MSRRDEFSAPTKRALAARAGHVCSFKGCPRHTSGPSAEAGDASVNLGEACHIRAASPGVGARRYDPTMTHEERRSIDNGIWMCRTHAKLIDSDEATYTVERLHQWKREAEARAERRLRGASAEALTAGRIYGSVRSPSVEFVGREEQLFELEKLLLNVDAVRIAASVEGLPGIGKTELALQLVFRLARDGVFPGGIFWLDAENPDLVSAWGGEIANALGIGPGTLEERTVQALRGIEDQPAATLLVLDNVDAWQGEMMPSPLPQGPHLRTLVTTRHRHLGGTGFKHVEVGFLAPGLADQLMSRVSGRELAGTPGYQELLEYLGGHALATELAGAFLGAYPEETPAGYLAELRGRSGADSEVRDLVRYQRTVEQAFQALWDRLPKKAQSAWRLAACFAIGLVHTELAEAVGLDSASRRRLRRLHLIDADDEGRWWMHRLTRDFGQRAGTAAEVTATKIDFVRGCAAFAKRIELADGFRPYLAHRMHLDRAVELAPVVLDHGDPELSRFQDRIATGRHSAGDFQGARRLFEQALESDLDNLGENHPSVATRRSNLAVVLQDLGDLPGARRLLEQALESDLDNLGENHPAVAPPAANLALLLEELGERGTAVATIQIALRAVADQPEGSYHRVNVERIAKQLDLEE